MPLSGVRYRFKTTKRGRVRLAFKGNKVVEAKSFPKKSVRVRKTPTRTHRRR